MTSTGNPLPTYRVFPGREIISQTAAQTVTSDAAQLQTWHQEHIGLTAQEATQFKQVAAIHVAAIDGVKAA